MLTISTLFFVLFMGISMAVPFVLFLIWIRASLARLRFDQLLNLGWAHILPLTIGWILFVPALLFIILIL